jgi:hypothetical protein
VKCKYKKEGSQIHYQNHGLQVGIFKLLVVRFQVLEPKHCRKPIVSMKDVECGGFIQVSENSQRVARELHSDEWREYEVLQED